MTLPSVIVLPLRAATNNSYLQGVETIGDVEVEVPLFLPFGGTFQPHVERQFVDVSLALRKERLLEEPELHPFFFHQQLSDEVLQCDVIVGVEDHKGIGFRAVAFADQKPKLTRFQSLRDGWGGWGVGVGLVAHVCVCVVMPGTA